MMDALREVLREVPRETARALRGLRNAPALAIPAILSIALGVGANTAIYGVARGLLIEPLPYADSDRLVILWNRSPGLNIAEDWFSTAQYFDIRNTSASFEQVAIAIGGNQNLTGAFEPQRVGVIRVSSNLLPMLGAQAAAGRLFVPEEDVPGRSGVVILSDGSWKRRFASDPDVVGKSLTLNGQPYAIVGVLPPEFSLPREVLPTLGTAEDGELFLPLPLAETAVTNRGNEDYNIVAKLRPGIGVAQAQAEMDALTARLRAERPDVYPPNGGLTFGVVPLLEQVVGGVRRTLWILGGSVAFVLLIACANVANLMLSRALAREREMALRAALGATARQLARQMLVESLLLAAAGGLVGAALAVLAVAALQAARPQNLPRLANIDVDGGVLLFSLAVTALAGILFGLAPAVGARHVAPAMALASGGRGTSGANAVFGRGRGLRRGLVVSQIALSAILLLGSGLLIRSFARLRAVEPGFDPKGVLTCEVTLTAPRYADAVAVRAAYQDLWLRLGALPGVASVGGVTSLPLSGFFAWGPIAIEGREPAPGEKFINADQRVASGRYFETMGIPLLAGRGFAESDTPDRDRVVIVDKFFAQEYFGGADAVGRRIQVGALGPDAPWRTIVGVVDRVKQYGLDQDGRIVVYVPHTQSGARSLSIVLKTAGDPGALVPSVRAAIRGFDADLPLYRVRPMTAWVDLSLSRQRFATTLLTAFAALALALSALGLYGLMAFLVSQGTREIGVRIAIGATERDVLRQILSQGLGVAVTGIAVGSALALLLAGLMSGLIFGVGLRDPATFTVAPLALALVATLAIWIPARRAARTNPIDSLRSE